MNQINILVPELPESITNATIIHWNKKVGDIIKQDEILVEIETEKVILEVPASVNGILKSILKNEGETVYNKQIIGLIKETKNIQSNKNNIKNLNNIKKINQVFQNTQDELFQRYLSPSIRRIMLKNNSYSLHTLKKKKNFIHKNKDSSKNTLIPENKNSNNRNEKRVLMTPIRKRISEKLLYSKNNTAMLTTFNEVNMQSIINLRNLYGKSFQENYKVRLGFMSFFIKAVVESLKIFKTINARIEKNYIVYYDYFDINVAIATNTGLVTPVLKDVNSMTMSQIEKKIKYFIAQSNQEKLQLSDLIGGNFTITNGGTFGSLLSTPIINPPQSAILGMHTIQDRPISINQEIKIAPMMYIALSYDHRLIDGKEAVGFLNMVKNKLEDFTRVLLEI
ncbi:Dihydrolipoyllysine-residue succinyltransferase component of 2-oxoglutarate dehydrogenase complex [Buchnera aphidicola (Phyllaphis fagi)]|uniref:dihydrolipoyllysine-residue succinyltransferase n=1 Tax=Buchnera aphidicola TaxID=9 RepID=UPI00346439F7